MDFLEGIGEEAHGCCKENAVDVVPFVARSVGDRRGAFLPDGEVTHENLLSEVHGRILA